MRMTSSTEQRRKKYGHQSMQSIRTSTARNHTKVEPGRKSTTGSKTGVQSYPGLSHASPVGYKTRFCLDHVHLRFLASSLCCCCVSNDGSPVDGSRRSSLFLGAQVRLVLGFAPPTSSNFSAPFSIPMCDFTRKHVLEVAQNRFRCG